MAATYNTEVSQKMLYDARSAVRIKRTEIFDDELKDLISAARKELVEIGILPEKAYDDADPLTKRAVILYVKAEFGLDNPDAPRYRESFDLLKRHLALATDYIEAPSGEG